MNRSGEVTWVPASAPVTPTDPIGALLVDVRQSAMAVDGHDPMDEADSLELKHRGLRESRLAVAERGFAWQRGTTVVLAVHPADRERGVGARLLDAVMAADDIGYVAWSHGNHPAAAALAESRGWAKARDLWVMRRSLTAPLPAQDLTTSIRPIRESEHHALLQVNAAAFADHPEQGTLGPEGLAERMAEPWFDPAGLLVAVDEATGDVLGFHWTKRHGPDLGEVYVVGVSPQAQGRGLGRRLTLAGLHHLARVGARDVLLYVEAANQAAIATYRGLGFTHADHDTHVQYRRG